MKGVKPIYHILFWTALYLLWIALFRSYSIRLSRTITIEFCYLVFITADYYVLNDLILPKLFHKGRYLLFSCSVLGLIVVSSWLRTLVALAMNTYYFHSVVLPDTTTLFLQSLLNISLWVLLITTGKMLLERRESQYRMELLEKEKTKNELDFLKAQINPHALFNSINTIYGHIEKSNQKARNVLLQFSEMLRYQLYDCGGDKVSLAREVDYVKNYTAFQLLRKDNRLIVHTQWGDIDPQLQIAPLLLVVLIENAFKFVGNTANEEHKICIQISTSGNTLYSCFSNTKESRLGSADGQSNGIGLINLKRRLELLYGPKYVLRTTSTKNWYESHLNIDLA